MRSPSFFNTPQWKYFTEDIRPSFATFAQCPFGGLTKKLKKNGNLEKVLRKLMGDTALRRQDQPARV